MTPSAEQVKRVVGLATYAPSTDNCQPFRFHWDGDRLSVSHDDGRARHPLNAGRLASYLSLGCLLEALRVAAASEGLGARFELGDPTRDSVAPWAKLSFLRRPEERLGSGSVLLDRCTDRRCYRGGSLTDPVFQRLDSGASAFAHARLRLRRPSEALVEYVAHVETLVWSYGPTQHGIAKWFRLSRREAEATRDGMTRRSLGVDPLTAQVLRLSRRGFKYQRVLNRLGFLRTFRRRVRARVRSATALGCIAIDAPAMEAVVEAGQLAMRAWLDLNQGGYGFQPLSSATLLILAEAAGVLPAELPGAFAESIAPGKRLLHAEFGLGSGEIPAWIFRTGRSPLLPKHARNPRLELRQILSEETAR